MNEIIPWWKAAVCLILTPVMFVGLVAGFVGEMFMMGYRAGKEQVEGVSDKASSARANRKQAVRT